MQGGVFRIGLSSAMEATQVQSQMRRAASSTQSSCSTVACPSNSHGANVPAGSSCNAGYSGAVSAVTSSLFYFSACSTAASPANSRGARRLPGKRVQFRVLRDRFSSDEQAVLVQFSPCSGLLAISCRTIFPSNCSCNRDHAGGLSAMASGLSYTSS